jgi:predicted small lipoprotein YifL
VRTARTFLVVWLAAGVAACGLKGPLELPERSSNIVIRGPGQPPAVEAPAGTTPGASTPGAPTPGAPTPPETPTKPEQKEERLPPPPLPDGNPGSSRGG